MTLATTNGGINFNHVAFNCELLYDVEGLKEVDYIKDKPFLFKAKPNDRGDQVQLELRLKVLTSQHEDMFFICSIQGFDPHTKSEIPELHTYSHPIKVISKPEQLRKKDVTHKKTINETIIDIITKIEQTQTEHTKVLGTIFSRVAPGNSLPAPAPSPEQSVTTKRSAPEPASAPAPTPVPTPTPEQQFEMHFAGMLKAYQSLSSDGRASKLRRLATDLTPPESNALNQLIDQLNVHEPAPFNLNLSGQFRALAAQDLPKSFADLMTDYNIF